jgi:bifunctional non-homologous end joining protein LigD
MSLSTYNKKRTFRDTPEPQGGKAKGPELRFVIQKHDATRLHYDFRLEMEGVLKSWAVPKGPSLNPADKRLAMMVEDHPYDYRTFEGIIPEGNYGAGTVIVWDEGTYEPLEKTIGKKEQEKSLLKQLKAGSVKIVMKGKKLKGEFALVRTNGMGDNSWLLIKHRDKYASENDITQKDKSVISNKTIEKIAIKPAKVWQSNRAKSGAAVKQKVSGKPAAVKKKVKADLNGLPKMALPETISPMLATLVDKPFDEPGWAFEIKWDGYRAIAICNGKSVELISRNNKSFNEKFYPVHAAVKALGLKAVIDGEVTVLNDKGISHFGSLQNWRSEADGALIYYVFDLLWLDGHNLMGLPLTERREILRAIIPADGIVRISENFETSATEFLEAAGKMGMEGIIAKKTDSEYHPGDRTRDWLKIKVNKRHEVVIGGYTINDGSDKAFSSLLVGVHQDGVLKYTGKIGTGFSDKLQREMLAKFKPLVTPVIPFEAEPDINKPSRFRPDPPHATAVWLKPQLVCEVSYAEITSDGVMRHPSFEGMREDKKAKDVMRETAVKTEKVIKKKSVAAKKSASKKVAPVKTVKTPSSLLKPPAGDDRKSLLNPTEDTQVKKVNGAELKFTNLSKIYWPKEQYTKRDAINYYYQIAPYILPYLNNRPQSMNRYPNGIKGQSFYQKDVTGSAPDWAKLFPYETSEEKGKNYFVCTSEAGLLYMANLGCIEMHPWSSRADHPDNPDWCLIDLDPGTKTVFEQVIETAQVTRQVLKEIGVEGYCKTSGSTGLHIYIPLEPKYTYDQSQLFARWIVTQVQERLPDFTTMERVVKKRRGKMYLDFLQNRAQATLAAAYSIRPKPGATVSMPLHWDEVKKGLQISDFTIKNAVRRVKANGDIFKPVLTEGIDLLKVLGKITDAG